MNPDEWLARGEELLCHRSMDAALTALTQAAATGIEPERCGGSLWMTHMLLGDFEAAWRQSDALRERNATDPHRFWNGEGIAGKRLVVRCLHGLGDAVQMLRYAPLLKSLAGDVVWEVPPRLYSLAPFFEGVDSVITWGEAAPVQPSEWDVQMEVMELPYFLRTQLRDLPLATRYLALPEGEIRKAAELMGPRIRPRMGMVWGSGDWNPSRDIAYASIRRLIEDERCEFWSLQARPPAERLMRHQVGVTGDGLVALAATIVNLDVVITVDTLAAHLAGALGMPCWLMLQHAADWRWMHARSESPWYPSLELFRQPSPGDWAAVVSRVQQRLGSLALRW